MSDTLFGSDIRPVHAAVSPVSAYVWSLSSRPELVDQLASLEGGDAAGDPSVCYPDHLSMSALQAGVRAGRLRQGKFFARDDNYLEGTVMVEGLEQPVS